MKPTVPRMDRALSPLLQVFRGTHLQSLSAEEQGKSAEPESNVTCRFRTPVSRHFTSSTACGAEPDSFQMDSPFLEVSLPLKPRKQPPRSQSGGCLAASSLSGSPPFIPLCSPDPPVPSGSQGPARTVTTSRAMCSVAHNTPHVPSTLTLTTADGLPGSGPSTPAPPALTPGDKDGLLAGVWTSGSVGFGEPSWEFRVWGRCGGRS